MTDRNQRLAVIAALAWVGGLAGPQLSGRWWALAAVGAVAVALVRRWPAIAVGLGVGAAVALSAQVHQIQDRTGPVAILAQERAWVQVTGVVADDPRISHGRFGDRTVVRLRVQQISGRGHAWSLRSVVVALAPVSWSELRLGSTVRAQGRLSPSDADVAALLSATGDAEVVAAASAPWRAAEAVRSSVREVVADRPAAQRVLVPALVSGDETGITDQMVEDFQTTGLTHLMAVSGTNLTIILSCLLAAARWCGVRGRWNLVVAGLGIVGFIVVARTEPSVLRAAVMGTIGTLGLTLGRSDGLRTLAGAVVILLLISPALAGSVGFALSVSATFGILVWAPGWRDSLRRWLPGWLAEAVAVPTAAQLACTPLVAAISGQVSLVAVGTNLLAEPVVGPATIGGLLGGLLGLIWLPLGTVVAFPAALAVGWIDWLARYGAALPGAAVEWGTDPVAVALLVVLTAVAVWLGPRLARHRVVAVVATLLLVAAIMIRIPRFGWPPSGWVMVACDVGQGDGLVLRSGAGSAVVVDTGPDPGPIDRCLDDLAITTVTLLVITHFHADHVGGVAGVVDGRRVERVLTTGLLDPPDGVRLLRDSVGATPVQFAAAGEDLSAGSVRLQVLWPTDSTAHAGPGDGSTANDASVTLVAEVSGVRILLTGDLEPDVQQRVAAAWPGLGVDILKVPHHGSSHQDLDWLTSLGARTAVISVGADNDYGHPSPELVSALQAAGLRVWRTDLDGDVAFVVRDHELSAVTSR